MELVAFPELVITGYPPEDLLLKPNFVRDNAAAVQQVAAATRGLAAVVGFVDTQGSSVGEGLFNGAALLVNGRHVATYHKRRLPNYGVFDEKRYFRPGHECPVTAAAWCWITRGSYGRGARRSRRI